MPDPEKETATWKASDAWTKIVIKDDRATMSISVFYGLRDYSRTLPSGAYIAKRWRRLEDGVWWMGEYTEHSDSDLVGIIWREINVWTPNRGAFPATVDDLNAHETARTLENWNI